MHGLAFLIEVSVSGIGEHHKPVIFQDARCPIPLYPKTYPRIAVDCNRRFRTSKNKKAPIYGASLIFYRLYWTLLDGRNMILGGVDGIRRQPSNNQPNQ